MCDFIYFCVVSLIVLIVCQHSPFISFEVNKFRRLINIIQMILSPLCCHSGKLCTMGSYNILRRLKMIWNLILFSFFRWWRHSMAKYFSFATPCQCVFAVLNNVEQKIYEKIAVRRAVKECKNAKLLATFKYSYLRTH